MNEIKKLYDKNNDNDKLTLQSQRKIIQNLLNEKESEYGEIRINSKLNKFRDKKDNNKAENVTQKITGIDFSPAIEGKVKYHLKTMYVPLIQAECRERGIVFDPSLGIRALCKLIKDDEKQKHGVNYDERYFKPVSGENWSCID